ncbi:MAG: peptidase M3, partial [Pirellulales bacterium]
MREITVSRPEYAKVADAYAKFTQDFSSASTAESRLAAVKSWDNLRREIETWIAVVNLRFNQDTTNAEYEKEREYCDELTPSLTDLEVKFKRLLLDSAHRSELEKALGTQAFALWGADVMAFDPKIQDMLVQEAKLQAE